MISQTFELSRRNDVEGLGALFSEHIPNYRNLMNSYSALATAGQSK